MYSEYFRHLTQCVFFQARNKGEEVPAVYLSLAQVHFQAKRPREQAGDNSDEENHQFGFSVWLLTSFGATALAYPMWLCKQEMFNIPLFFLFFSPIRCPKGYSDFWSKIKWKKMFCIFVCCWKLKIAHPEWGIVISLENCGRLKMRKTCRFI